MTLGLREKHILFGVHITDRLRNAREVQDILTNAGRYIKTRIGLHEIERNLSSPSGIIILEMVGDEAECKKIAASLNALEGVEVQTMIFDHP